MSAPEKTAADASPDKVLAAGHPPAVKVSGGVRIVQHHKPEHKAEWTKEDDEIVAADAAASGEKKVVVDGAVVRGDKDFPAKAVRAFHDKPQPSHQQPHVHGGVRNIQQPKK